MSANYATWYLVETSDSSHMKICKTEKERDEYIAKLCEMISQMQIPNGERPRITIRIDRHVRPSGPIR